jgi:ribonuclease R
VQVLSLAMSMDVKSGFPEAAIKEADRIGVAIPSEELSRRLDLRDKSIFTIDPEDAKDFDDAIHIEELPNGHYELGVHIADVSHYVNPGEPIDEEAYARGTSVYLVDRVVPMLPEKLSNVVCSLRPDEDKLTFSCIMEVSKHGAVKRYEIRESVIHSKQRFTYEEAQQIIQGGYPDHPLASDVVTAARLARTLTKKRLRKGAVDFDLPEVKVVLDAKGNPEQIVRKERLEANRLIEEFMLLANRTVAEHIGKERTSRPFVYRVHDAPDAERIAQLAEYVRAFGYRLKLDGGTVSSKELNALFQHVKGSPEEPIIEDAALRAMAKATYTSENIGHYGLAFPFYTHFTSPIRRYPDLMVHRLLKQYARGKGAAPDREKLEARCVHCSQRERVAVEAERESVKLKKVEYMQRHVGDTFAGVVSGVTKFGVFVELSDVLVEGMVHVRDMDDDYYEYDERTFSLGGLHTGKTYRPGEPVEVVVAGANVESREIDLVFKE